MVRQTLSQDLGGLSLTVLGSMRETHIPFTDLCELDKTQFQGARSPPARDSSLTLKTQWLNRGWQLESFLRGSEHSFSSQ